MMKLIKEHIKLIIGRVLGILPILQHWLKNMWLLSTYFYIRVFRIYTRILLRIAPHTKKIRRLKRRLRTNLIIYMLLTLFKLTSLIDSVLIVLLSPSNYDKALRHFKKIIKKVLRFLKKISKK